MNDPEAYWIHEKKHTGISICYNSGSIADLFINRWQCARAQCMRTLEIHRLLGK